ncbi:MAG: type II toxin-antitoxin system VapC family toxin [archaeon GB-1867-035]|nr:type II toxin-antitoxin system VapC family toxin [Candidatus Culexmicrobium profundum]
MKLESGEKGVVGESEVNIVVDASVIVKWFVKEEYRDRALMLRKMHVHEKCLLIAPKLIIYEVCNALRFNPEFEEEDVMKASEALFQIHLKLEDLMMEDVFKVIRNSFKYNITFYDASYLTLAEKEGCPFVTADEKLYRKIRENPLVYLLSSERFYEIIS